jgi:plastocyanin
MYRSRESAPRSAAYFTRTDKGVEMVRMTMLLALGVLAVALPVVANAIPATEPEVEMEDFAFHPARLVVRPGALVVWKNRDSARHNARALKRTRGRAVFATRTGGDRARLTARAPRVRGIYRYICTIHPNMRGTLVVR